MQRTNPMRDFRDAKAMAQTLRQSLNIKAPRRNSLPNTAYRVAARRNSSRALKSKASPHCP
jgi:hypothetical protein